MLFYTALLNVRTPGVIVGPIAKVLGEIYNWLFNIIYGITQANALGLAIIAFTILVKLVLTPLIVKQQKATFEMQKLQPELNKIKKKYENKKDAESQQKMALEMQKLQKDNNVSMFGGCLPLLIQLPILYALFYIFQQAYMYVDVVGQNYDSIANVILNIPVDLRMDIFGEIAAAHAGKATLDLAVLADVKTLVGQITQSEWQTILASAGSYADQLAPLLTQKMGIEYFLGISIVDNPGLRFPEIAIPLLSAGTTYLSSKVMMSRSSATSMDENNPAMQSMKMMNYMMPIMMGVMTVTLPAGLGIYWTVSNLFQAAQTIIINKFFAAKEHRQAV
jgi:YidC/Oxa1 family membrane protein insertase